MAEITTLPEFVIHPEFLSEVQRKLLLSIVGRFPVVEDMHLGVSPRIYFSDVEEYMNEYHGGFGTLIEDPLTWWSLIHDTIASSGRQEEADLMSVTRDRAERVLQLFS